MCKTADYDVIKDCNMYAIHTIKKSLMINCVITLISILSRRAHGHLQHLFSFLFILEPLFTSIFYQI